MKSMRNLILAAKKFFTKKEEGAGLVEYALLVTFIAIACIAAMTALGTHISTTFNNIVQNL
jgi:Flp pilus assembly pilin Flp